MFCKKFFYEHHEFDSILRPILTWMRFIAFGKLKHIGSNSVESKFKTKFLLCHSYWMIFGALNVFGVGIWSEVQQLKKNSQFGPFRNDSLPTADLVTKGIQMVNLAVFSVGCHLVFLLKTGQSWENLRNTLIVIQEKLNPSRRCYRLCFKFIIALDLILFIVSIFGFCNLNHNLF